MAPEATGRLFNSLGQLLATALETVQLRLELLGSDVELEKQRLFDALWLTSLALTLFGLALVSFCGFILLLFWDSHRLAALALLSLLLAGASGYLLQRARSGLSRPGGMLQDSLIELRRDIEQLRTPGRYGKD